MKLVINTNVITEFYLYIQNAVEVFKIGKRKCKVVFSNMVMV